MKWIILAVIIGIVAYWLFQGKRKNTIEDPEVKTYEDKDFYLTSDDNVSEDESSPDSNNPRH